MQTKNRTIAGFMSAESIYSLAFYIVMVAAIAGVGAGVMSKTATAKAVSAVSILRANYQAEVSVAGYNGVPTEARLEVMSGGLLTAGAAASNIATLSGVGTFSIVNQRAPAGAAGTPMTRFTIQVMGIISPDQCKALASVGWGTWERAGNITAALTSATSIPSAAATAPGASGQFTTKGLIHTVCNLVTAAVPVNLALTSK